MKKLLIMGGSYFIGKRVVEALKEHYDTYVLNRGSKPLNDDKVKELVADRNDADQLKHALGGMSFDIVVDISALTMSQLELLHKTIDLTKLERFVFISSSAVYNIKKLKPPFKEDDDLGGDSPFRSYAQNKIDAEHYLISLLSASQLVMFRPPIVYGEENYVLRERLIFHLIDQGEPIFIPKSNNKISFVYAHDLANQVKEALDSNIPPGIYNVGDTKAISFYAWVHLIEEVMGKKTTIYFVDHKALDIDLRSFFPFFDYDNILDVSKIKRFSSCETPMHEGLKRAYDDYQKIKKEITIPDLMKTGFIRLKERYHH